MPDKIISNLGCIDRKHPKYRWPFDPPPPADSKPAYDATKNQRVCPYCGGDCGGWCEPGDYIGMPAYEEY